MKPVYTIMFFVSLALMIIAAGFLLGYGLNLGVDFRGGSLLEIQFAERPTSAQIVTSLSTAQIGALQDVSINSAGEQSIVIKSGPLSEEEHQRALAVLQRDFAPQQPTEVRFDSVGPAIGQELKDKSIRAVILVLLAVTLYIALVFRAMRRVLSPWAMGGAAIFALLHDLVIPLGIFAWLGVHANVQITAVFVAAVLTVLGYSVADTVVIFDRVRENVIRGTKDSFPNVVHTSVLQTLGRSINTTLTTLISLVAIYFFGGESIRYFALALMLGIGLGAYSSIFVASPLLVWLGRWRSS